MSPSTPDRNLALELVRVTEAAALSAGRWMGRGDKIAGDRAAVDAMRLIMGTISMAPDCPRRGQCLDDRSAGTPPDP